MRAPANPDLLVLRGYVFVRDDYGLVPEHRLVAEKKIGRSLRKGEVVHHRNLNRSDNRQANLRVFPTTSAHLAHHRRRRSIAFLKRYARFIAHVTGFAWGDSLDIAADRLVLLEETDAAPLAGCPTGAPASVSSSTAKAALIAEPGRVTPRRACGRAQTKGA